MLENWIGSGIARRLRVKKLLSRKVYRGEVEEKVKEKKLYIIEPERNYLLINQQERIVSRRTVMLEYFSLYNNNNGFSI